MAAPVLTRRQKTLLRKAIDRDGLVLVRGASAERVVRPLLDAGLVREVPSSYPDVAWRTDQYDRHWALALTPSGRAAALVKPLKSVPPRK